MLDLLDNLPCLRLSDDHLKAIILVMKECGTPNVPSFYALRKLQKKLTEDVGLKPRHHTSSLNNQFYMNHPNDLICLFSLFSLSRTLNLTIDRIFQPPSSANTYIVIRKSQQRFRNHSRLGSTLTK
jgi:hypothetical protein